MSTELGRPGARGPAFWDTIGLVFRVAFRNLGRALVLSLWVAVPAGVGAGLLAGLTDRLARTGGGLLDAPLPTILATGGALFVIAGFLVVAIAVLYPITHSALAWMGSKTALGEHVTLDDVLERVGDRGPSAVGAFLLVLLAVTAAPAGLALLAAVAGAALGPAGAAVFGTLALASLVYPGFVWAVRLSLTPAAVMVEDAGVTGALRSSRDAVRGRFWWVFAVLLLTGVAASLMASVAASVVTGASATQGARGMVAAGVSEAVVSLVSLAIAGTATGVVYAVRAGTRQAPVGEGLVVPAHPEDARAVADVHVRAWRVAYQGQIPDDILAGLSVADRERMWREEIERPSPEGRTWVLRAGGEVAAFAHTGPSRDSDAAPGTAEVNAVYVDPMRWGTGVGRRLLSHAVEDLRARGYPTATLWVLASNERARRFYEAAGWRTDGGEKTEQREGYEMRQVRYRVDLRGE